MYCIIYLDQNRRVKVFAEGGYQQEVLSGRVTIPSDSLNYSHWILTNDEEWNELSDVFLKFSTILFNKHSELN